MKNHTIYRIKTIRIELKIQDFNKKATSSYQAFKILSGIFQDLDADQEHFVVLTLNSRNAITGYKVVCSGGQAEAAVDLKVLFRNVLLLGAVSIIIAHNHPSGDLLPSDDDIELTHRIKKCCEFLGVGLLDHIIIAKDKYFSFAEKGIIST